MKANLEDIKDFFGRVFVSDRATMDLPSISKKVKGHIFEVKNWKITEFNVKRYNISHDVDNHFLTFVVSGVTIVSTLEASLSNKLLGRSTLRLETQIRDMKYLVALQTTLDDIKKMHSKISLEFELLSQSTEKNKLKKGLLTLLNKLGINTLIQKTMQTRVDAIFSTQFIQFMKKNLNIGSMDTGLRRRVVRHEPEMGEEEIHNRIRESNSIKVKTESEFKHIPVTVPSPTRESSKAFGFLNISGSGGGSKKRRTLGPLQQTGKNRKKTLTQKVNQKMKDKRRKTVIPRPSLPKLPDEPVMKQKLRQQQPMDFTSRQLQQPPPHSPIIDMEESSFGGPSTSDLKKEIALYKEIINDKIMQQKEVEEKLRMKELESLHFFLLATKMMNRGREMSTPELCAVKDSLQIFDQAETGKIMKEMKAFESRTKK